MFLPNISFNPILLWWEAIPPCPVIPSLVESLSPSSLELLQVLEGLSWISLKLLLSRLGDNPSFALQDRAQIRQCDPYAADFQEMQTARSKQVSDCSLAAIKWDKFTYRVREEGQFDPRPARVACKHNL